MNKSKVVIFCALALLAYGMWWGCDKSGNQTLAIVGDYEITSDELNEIFNPRWTYPSAEDEYKKRREALDSLIVLRLLIQAAYEKNIDKMEEIARSVLAFKDRFLIETHWERQLVEKAEPTEAELKEFYKRLEYKVRASHILVRSLDTAQMLLERIKNGENFEKLAYEYSIDNTAKRNKGDLGYFLWGDMVDELQQAAFSMQPGEVSPPIKSRLGYHIVKVVDRLPNEARTDFESMRESLVERVRSYKLRRRVEEYYKELRAKYPITIDTTTCQYLLHKREIMYPPMLLKNLPRSDFDLEQLDRNERELVIATWEGGQLTVYEYLTQAAKQIPLKLRPDFDDYDSLATTVFRLKVNDILTVEAHRNGVDNDPKYLKVLKRFKEMTMAETMREDSIPMPPPPDEAMMRQYYEEHPEEFTVPAKVHIYEILLSDELKARRLMKEIKSLEEFKKTAEKMTERVGKRIVAGDFGYIQRAGSFADIFDAAWETPVGAIGGPVIVDGKYSIFYVADKINAELKDFLGMKRDIMQRIINRQKQEAFEKWLEERKKSTKIVVDEDALWATIDMDKYTQQDTLSSSG
ncbi:MAG: peptidylprolyl isomerase [Candidatus Zixiibacteriota bacterium]